MAEHETPAPPASGGILVNKLFVVGFMGGVVMLEAILAYLFIPSADHIAALAQEKMTKQLPAAIADEHAHEPEQGDAVVEIDLGEYSVTVSQPTSTLALRVDFHLVGTVGEKEQEEVNTLFERHKHRFRDLVLVEIRNSDPADLSDPELGLIKRRILEKSNTLFGKPLLRGVLFSDFSYLEQ